MLLLGGRGQPGAELAGEAAHLVLPRAQAPSRQAEGRWIRRLRRGIRIRIRNDAEVLEQQEVRVPVGVDDEEGRDGPAGALGGEAVQL